MGHANPHPTAVPDSYNHRPTRAGWNLDDKTARQEAICAQLERLTDMGYTLITANHYSSYSRPV
jgi:hypothetical protein